MKEGLRELKKSGFKFKVNADGREYIELAYNQASKKEQGDEYNEINDNPTILPQPNKVTCPVKSFKLYLSKLTKIEAFFQQPNPYFKNTKRDKWYKGQAVGEGTIAKFLS